MGFLSDLISSRRHSVKVEEDGTIPNLAADDVSVSAKPQQILIHGRFIDNEDGTVTDTSTNLTWMRCAIGQTWDGTTCTGSPTMHSWDEAASIRIDFAGYSDWRLPEFEELKSLFDPQFSKPAMNHIAFPHIPSACYWSSTTFQTNYHAKLCKYLCFNDDRSTGQYTVRNKFHVRLVRDASAQTDQSGQAPDLSSFHQINK